MRNQEKVINEKELRKEIKQRIQERYPNRDMTLKEMDNNIEQVCYRFTQTLALIATGNLDDRLWKIEQRLKKLEK